MESLLDKIDKYICTSEKNDRINRTIIDEIERQKDVNDLSDEVKQILADGGILK